MARAVHIFIIRIYSLLEEAILAIERNLTPREFACFYERRLSTSASCVVA